MCTFSFSTNFPRVAGCRAKNLQRGFPYDIVRSAYYNTDTHHYTSSPPTVRLLAFRSISGNVSFICRFVGRKRNSKSEAQDRVAFKITLLVSPSLSSLSSSIIRIGTVYSGFFHFFCSLSNFSSFIPPFCLAYPASLYPFTRILFSFMPCPVGESFHLFMFALDTSIV